MLIQEFFREQYGGLIVTCNMEEITENKVEKEISKEGINVTEFEIYKGPFPVVKPAKELSKEELAKRIEIAKERKI